MAAKLVARDGQQVTVQITVSLTDSMLDTEEHIQEALNDAGNLVTAEALKELDTHGEPLMLGSEKWFSKGALPKKYQTPYGEIEVNRHVYQRSCGGETWCPMEDDARIIVTSTPRLAKQISHKYAHNTAGYVQNDLADNHGRVIARSFIQNVADAVGSIAQSREETWEYTTPKQNETVSSVAIGVDGTCMLMCRGGYREAMTGTISLYNPEGKRLHTLYVGATPEHGKATFYERMEREIYGIKQDYPDATYAGIADGASTNWRFLTQHTDYQILDYYHATEYLSQASKAVNLRNKAEQKAWFVERCSQLKHEVGAATSILREMIELSQKKLSKTLKEGLDAAITYFQNHQHQMNYSDYRQHRLPIGSGVTESACKVLVKQRLCQAGMRWAEKGAKIVLSLRSIALSSGRWEQFWQKIDTKGAF